MLAWVISTILALVSIGLAIRAVKVRVPMYAVAGRNLASSSISKYGELEVRYKGERVSDATVTEICLWNHGREPIRRDDVYPGNPILISVRGEYLTILSCKILASNRQKEIRPRIEPVDVDQWELSFDCLEQDDWIVLQVLHTGHSPLDCDIDGSIIGCKAGIRRIDPTRQPLVLLPSLILLVSIVVALIMFFASSGDTWPSWAVGPTVAHLREERNQCVGVKVSAFGLKQQLYTKSLVKKVMGKYPGLTPLDAISREQKRTEAAYRRALRARKLLGLPVFLILLAGVRYLLKRLTAPYRIAVEHLPSLARVSSA